VVKAIADNRSLGKAAQMLAINQSTVFRKLSQIERRIDARLFKRGHSAHSLTTRGE
jgi:DNA-binding transcriptional LysR family regulator